MATNYNNTNKATPNNGGGRHFSRSGNGGNSPKQSKAKVVSIVAITLGVILLLVAGGLFAKDYIGRKKAEKETENIQQEVIIPSTPGEPTVAPEPEPEKVNASIPVVDWAKLREINPDICGWLQIPGTVINYPVVQGATNDTYIRTTIRGENAVAGSIFLDSDSSRALDDQHSIFYGHNMKNGSMFHAIASFVDKGVFDKHRTIYYVTPEKNYVLKTLACYITDGNDAEVRIFSWPDDKGRSFTDYVKSRMSNSVVQASDINVDEVTHLYEFSTCSYSRADGRTILMAVDDPDAATKADENATPVNDTEGQMVPAAE